MKYYVGLDVSVKLPAVCIVDETGTVVRDAALCTESSSLASFLKGTGLRFERIGLEAGPLSSWLHNGLSAAGLPVIVVEARHMQTALSAMRNKTDRNDARGIAQMMRTGWFRQVHVKSARSQEIRLLLVNRDALLCKRRDIDNAIRGTLKVFGFKVGAVSRTGFEERVVSLLADRSDLLALVRPMLTVRQVLLEQFFVLHRRLKKMVRDDEVCRLLMTAPGVGAVVSAAYMSGVDDPTRFAKSHSVGAHFGMTPRTYASGEIERTGRISKCGDGLVRAALYEAAHVVLTRLTRWCTLKAWGLRVAKRAGMHKAKVAVARKLAVILHRMWTDGSTFRWGKEEAAA
ncbi:MAG: IS110 family transposase [bacterium]|nr:IS110 family transposase [bacterium]